MRLKIDPTGCAGDKPLELAAACGEPCLEILRAHDAHFFAVERLALGFEVVWACGVRAALRRRAHQGEVVPRRERLRVAPCERLVRSC